MNHKHINYSWEMAHSGSQLQTVTATDTLQSEELSLTETFSLDCHYFLCHNFFIIINY